MKASLRNAPILATIQGQPCQCRHYILLYLGSLTPLFQGNGAAAWADAWVGETLLRTKKARSYAQ